MGRGLTRGASDLVNVGRRLSGNNNGIDTPSLNDRTGHTPKSIREASQGAQSNEHERRLLEKHDEIFLLIE